MLCNVMLCNLMLCNVCMYVCIHIRYVRVFLLLDGFSLPNAALAKASRYYFRSQQIAAAEVVDV